MQLKNSDIGHLESEINMLKSEKAQVASEMSAVNQVKIITFIADNDYCVVDMAMAVIIIPFYAISLLFTIVIYAAHRRGSVWI